LTYASAFVAVLIVPAGVVANTAILRIDIRVGTHTGSTFFSKIAGATSFLAGEAGGHIATVVTLAAMFVAVIWIETVTVAFNQAAGTFRPFTFSVRTHRASRTLDIAPATMVGIRADIHTRRIAVGHISYALTLAVSTILVIAAGVVARTTVIRVAVWVRTRTRLARYPAPRAGSLTYAVTVPVPRPAPANSIGAIGVLYADIVAKAAVAVVVLEIDALAVA
jgi:hypothetical protein